MNSEKNPYPFIRQEIETHLRKTGDKKNAYQIAAEKVTQGEVLTLADYRTIMSSQMKIPDSERLLFYITSGRFVQATGVEIVPELYEDPCQKTGVLLYDWQQRDLPKIQEQIQKLKGEIFPGRGLSEMCTSRLKVRLAEAFNGSSR